MLSVLLLGSKSDREGGETVSLGRFYLLNVSTSTVTDSKVECQMAAMHAATTPCPQPFCPVTHLLH